MSAARTLRSVTPHDKSCERNAYLEGHFIDPSRFALIAGVTPAPQRLVAQHLEQYAAAINIDRLSVDAAAFFRSK